MKLSKPELEAIIESKVIEVKEANILSSDDSLDSDHDSVIEASKKKVRRSMRRLKTRLQVFEHQLSKKEKGFSRFGKAL